MIDIYEALIAHLLSSSISYITSDDIAYDNSEFDPVGKTAWLSCYFMPTGRSTRTKDSVGMTDTGILQITAHVALNDKLGNSVKYGKRAYQIIDDVLAAFEQNTHLSVNDTTLSIRDSTTAKPQPSESWYSIPISINYIRI